MVEHQTRAPNEQTQGLKILSKSFVGKTVCSSFLSFKNFTRMKLNFFQAIHVDISTKVKNQRQIQL